MGIYSNYITESTLPPIENINCLDEELDNFNKIVESIDILNENGIILEGLNLSNIKTKIINAFKAIGKFIVKIGKYIASIFGNLKDKLLPKIKEAIKVFNIKHDKEEIAYYKVDIDDIEPIKTIILDFPPDLAAEKFMMSALDLNFHREFDTDRIDKYVQKVKDINIDDYLIAKETHGVLSTALKDVYMNGTNIYLSYSHIKKILDCVENFNKKATDIISKQEKDNIDYKKCMHLFRLTRAQSNFIKESIPKITDFYNKYFVKQYKDLIDKYKKSKLDDPYYDKATNTYDFDAAEEYMKSSGKNAIYDIDDVYTLNFKNYNK